jgi:hypothetical protein
VASRVKASPGLKQNGEWKQQEGLKARWGLGEHNGVLINTALYYIRSIIVQGAAEDVPEGWSMAIVNGPLGDLSLQLHMRRFSSLVCALLVVVCSGGHAVAQEQTPGPVPPPLERPQVLPTLPGVQTFAICGVGTKCECDNVVSFAQAREGQSCTVTSTTGSCTFQAGENDVGVCCVCRP